MQPLLEVKNLIISIKQKKNQTTPLLNNISFCINKGESMALIGESG